MVDSIPSQSRLTCPACGRPVHLVANLEGATDDAASQPDGLAHDSLRDAFACPRYFGARPDDPSQAGRADK